MADSCHQVNGGQQGHPNGKHLVFEKNGVSPHLTYQASNDFQHCCDPAQILHNPHFNKATAFTKTERETLNLRGLLPSVVEDIDTQLRRCYAQFQRFEVPMSKYIYLASLRERNDTLFYKLIIKHIEECMPFIYTPTVGQACLEFGLHFRQAEGMYFCKSDMGHIRRMLDNWRPNSDSEVGIIVVTDGSRILGLGDLGACGMGIPLGKLSLYVAAGGFHPATTLPVVLDAGTDNDALLKDEFYLGMKHRRLEDAEYYPFVDEFMNAVKDKWPTAVLQFEDFSNNHCFNLLQKYRNQQPCFNDDIQGTGITIAAGFLNALKASRRSTPKSIEDLKLIFCGAGSAGTGVADEICVALTTRYGLTDDEALNKFYMLDSKGLLTKHRADYEKMPDFKKRYARTDITEEFSSLLDVVNLVKPGALFGLSGHAKMFTEVILSRMGEINSQPPIIFPLSNPTSKSECSFEEAFDCTGGRLIFASGSPFPPLVRNGKTYTPPQGNNLYAFPGIGFGTWLSGARSVTPGMLNAAMFALADSVPQDAVAQGNIYPTIPEARRVSALIATAVLKQAHAEGVARSELPYEDSARLFRFVNRSMYTPEYLAPVPHTPVEDIL